MIPRPARVKQTVGCTSSNKIDQPHRLRDEQLTISLREWSTAFLRNLKYKYEYISAAISPVPIWAATNRPDLRWTLTNGNNYWDQGPIRIVLVRIHDLWKITTFCKKNDWIFQHRNRYEMEFWRRVGIGIKISELVRHVQDCMDQLQVCADKTIQAKKMVWKSK